MSQLDNVYPPTVEPVADSTGQSSMGWLAHIKTAQLDTSEVQTEDSAGKDCTMRLPTMDDLNFQSNSDFENQAFKTRGSHSFPIMSDLNFQTEKVSKSLSVKKSSSQNQGNTSKDTNNPCINVMISKTSSQNCQNETDPRSELMEGSSEACLKEVVDNFFKDRVIQENIGSSTEKTFDISNEKLKCEKCRELSSEVARLNLLLRAAQSNQTNELTGIRKALEDQKVLNEELKINLDKQIEKNESLTNQNFEEEIGNIFLLTSILDEETDECKTKKLFRNCSDDKKNKMIEESSKKLSEITKRLTQVKNRYLKVERKSRDSSNVVKKESSNKVCKKEKRIKRKSAKENSSEPQGLLVPKRKRIKMEAKNRDLSNIRDTSNSNENTSEISQLKAHIIEYENKIETFNRSIQNLKDIIAERERDLIEKDILVKSLRKDLEMEHSEKEKLKQKNLLLSEERDKQDQINAENLHSNELLRCKISNFSSNTADRQKNQKELEQVSSNLEKIKQENKVLAEENQKLEKQIINIDEKLSEKDKTIEFLHSKIENFASNTVERQLETEKLNNSKNSLTKENTDMKKEITLLKVKEDNLKFESAKAKEESDMFHEELIKVRKELEKCRNDLDERKKLENQHSLEILQIKEKYKTFSANNLAAKEDNDMLHQELQKSKDALIKATKELQKRQEEEVKNVEKLTQLREELERRRMEIGKLQKDLLVRIKECANANEKLSQKEKSIENYAKEVIKMKQELELNSKSLSVSKEFMNQQQNYIRQLEREFVRNQENKGLIEQKDS